MYQQRNWTPLYIASWKGSDWIVEQLLTRGADVNYQDGVRCCMCSCSATLEPQQMLCVIVHSNKFYIVGFYNSILMYTFTLAWPITTLDCQLAWPFWRSGTSTSCRGQPRHAERGENSSYSNCVNGDLMLAFCLCL